MSSSDNVGSACFILAAVSGANLACPKTSCAAYAFVTPSSAARSSKDSPASAFALIHRSILSALLVTLRNDDDVGEPPEELLASDLNINRDHVPTRSSKERHIGEAKDRFTTVIVFDRGYKIYYLSIGMMFIRSSPSQQSPLLKIWALGLIDIPNANANEKFETMKLRLDPIAFIYLSW
mmetsp:Transcript_11242/g.26687  ORF Transcript_11242/g.26687 Transcript_11242/m.26687 type:complete len:179 (+) Transcript_11242:624-1160(+)